MLDRVRVEHGDCLERMRAMLAEGVRVDAVVTDPPYHLQSIVDRHGREGSAPIQQGSDGAFARVSRGFMGKQWDGGRISFEPRTWQLALMLLKPGGYLVSFGGTRTAHRIFCAIEDAGAEICDTLAWIYGSGFPKSHDAERDIAVQTCSEPGRHFEKVLPKGDQAQAGDHICDPTPASLKWQGFGTALKPAFEPIVVAQRTFDDTTAVNLLKHGVGALNIDATRVPTDEAIRGSGGPVLRFGGENARPGHDAEPRGANPHPLGRWPANVLHDGSDDVMAAFAGAGEKGAKAPVTRRGAAKFDKVYGAFAGHEEPGATFYGDAGSPARFFYCAKASKAERAGSKHPTVKPLALLRWIVRLAVPPGGLVLDIFGGSGTTAEAALLEGMRAIVVEREAEYIPDIERRIARATRAIAAAQAAQ